MIIWNCKKCNIENKTEVSSIDVVYTLGQDKCVGRKCEKCGHTHYIDYRNKMAIPYSKELVKSDCKPTKIGFMKV